MRITSIGLIRELVVEAAKFLSLEALDLAEVPKLLLAIISISLAVG